MKKNLFRKCAICGNKEGRVLHHIKMMLPKEYPIPSEYDVVACTRCGFTYADVKSTQDDYNLYYSTCNMYSASTKIGKDNTKYGNKIRLSFIEKYVDKSSTILDTGFGGGDFLKLLSESGYDTLYGIDPSIKSVESLRKENTSIICETGNLFDEPTDEWKNKFDCVCCLAVIEHVYDLDKVIHCLSQYLKPETGLLYLDMPNVYGYSKYPNYIPRYFNQEHINHFSLITLDGLLRKNGFSRISIDSDCEVEVGLDAPEMQLQAIYQYSTDESALYIENDNKSEESINAYFSKREEIESIRDNVIEEFVASCESLAIWGVGSYCMQLLETVPTIKEKVECFIDNNETKWGMEILGKRVYPPSYLLDRQDIPVLICVMSRGDQIVSQMKSENMENDYLQL